MTACAATVLLLVACRRSDARTDSLEPAVATDSAVASERKPAADTTSRRKTAPTRMTPAPRTDRTPSIPVNPGTVKPGPATAAPLPT
jgi:hypothetical protein